MGVLGGGVMRRSVYGSELEWLRWVAAAEAAGLSLNAWVRRSLCGAAELEEALRRQAVGEDGVAVGFVSADESGGGV